MPTSQLSESAGAGPSFEVAEQGYAPAAVQATMAQLAAERGAFDRRAAELEAEIAALTGTPATLRAIAQVELMLREAYADAHAIAAEARSAADRARGAAQAEVAAESAQLDVEIAEVHETAVAAGKRMVALADKRAADHLHREETTIDRAAEYADFLVARARTRGTFVATRTMQTVNDERHLLSGDLTGRSSVGPDRRRGLAREAAALKAQAKQIEQDAIREAAALRTSAASQAEELHASAAGAVERLEIEVGQAMTDLTAAMASLGGALGKVRGEIEERPAAAHKATRKAPAVKSTAAPKRRPTRATTTGPTPEPVTPAAAVGPVTHPEPIAPAARVKPVAKPEPIAPAATVESVVAPEPIAPAAAVARPAIPQPTRMVPVVANAVRSAELKPKLAKPADSGFVRLTPPPGVPARRVVPASVPPAAVAAARRIRRTVTAASATAAPEPMTVAQVPGGPSCLATATSGTAAVTVLRIRT
ncbi:MAG TPA: hypothetical protein VHV82_23370 [Sporichthyaceae bacterium]|nr:hypothetical protein [Sporichthyaceae bacterium]